MTKYLINDIQLTTIVREARENNIVNRIVAEIRLSKNKLNESSMRSSAVEDIILKYSKKGHLSEAVINKLAEKNIEY